MKLTYSKTTPTKLGLYWYQHGPDMREEIVRVFRDPQKHLSVQYGDLSQPPTDGDDEWGDTDFIENYSKGQFAGPITRPAPAVWEDAP